jgi:post-segregation antitoxin (ccd killing protein)
MGNVLRDTHFTEIAETKPDSKNRVTLGKLAMKAHHYKIFVNEAGQIVLDPQLSIPAAEMWLFENKKALASVVGGLADAKAGRVVKSKEDFSKYLDDDK